MVRWLAVLVEARLALFRWPHRQRAQLKRDTVILTLFCVRVCNKRMLMPLCRFAWRVAANNISVVCVNRAEKCGQWESFQLRTVRRAHTASR